MPDRSLPALLQATTVRAQHGPPPPAPIQQVSQDSRTLVPGACFVAVPGFHVDGHDFLEAALAAGAQAVVVQSDRRPRWQPLLDRGDVAVVETPDTRAALADLAAAYHGFPARALTVIGVTGTDGKTTTCYLLSSILEAASARSGLISGVQFKIAEEWRTNAITQTSPEAPLVQSLLAEMVERRVTHAVIESTSHGLALHRLDHCDYDVAAFTGLSDDHLDFHASRAAYLAAKLRLFQALDTAPDKGVPKRGVVHADDPDADAIRAATGAPLLRVGFNDPSLAVSASDLALGPAGSTFRLTTPSGSLATRLALPVAFNVRNALLAAGAASALGIDLAPIADGIRALRGVPGRLEPIDAGQPFTVVVDAAATTAAFQALLAALKPLLPGRLIVVFGCAGERDRGRRRGMARAAADYADYALLTNENPRSEAPEGIIAEIAAALRAAGRRPGLDFEEEPDRRAAIARAFALARPHDYVLIAGKGAEQSLIIGETVHPWDDRAVARELLEARPA